MTLADSATHDAGAFVKTRITDTLVNVFFAVWPHEGRRTLARVAVGSRVVTSAAILTRSLVATDVNIDLTQSSRVARLTHTLARIDTATVVCLSV